VFLVTPPNANANGTVVYEEVRILTKCECNGPCTKKCEDTDEIVLDRTNPSTHPFPASPSPLLSPPLLLSCLLPPLFVFVSKFPFLKNLLHAKMHSAYEHPKKIFSKGNSYFFQMSPNNGLLLDRKMLKKSGHPYMIDRKVHIKVGIVDIGRCIKSGDHRYRKVHQKWGS